MSRKTTEWLINVRVKCRTKSGAKELHRIAQKIGAYGWNPKRLYCEECKDEWEVDAGLDIHNVYCSNCYSPRVLCLQAIFEVLDE